MISVGIRRDVVVKADCQGDDPHRARHDLDAARPMTRLPLCGQ